MILKETSAWTRASACRRLDGGVPFSMPTGVQVRCHFMLCRAFRLTIADQTREAKACPHQCDFMPGSSEHRYSVLQCDPNNETFCCRAFTDQSNCCNTPSATFKSDITIGQILLPGTVDTVNTTYSTGKLTMSNLIRAYTDSRQYTTLERAIKARWLEELWGAY